MIRRLPLVLQEILGDLPLLLMVAVIAHKLGQPILDIIGYACWAAYGVNVSRDVRARVRAERRRREDLANKERLLAKARLVPLPGSHLKNPGPITKA